MNKESIVLGKRVNDIKIVERVYDPNMDLYAVFGKVKGPSPAPYVLGWQKRGKKKLHERVHFADWSLAKEQFMQAAYGATLPSDPKFYMDDQAEAAYIWEHVNVEPYQKEIKRKEARELVKQVSADYGIKPPTFHWLTECSESKYFPEKHIIEFGHRDNISLLHELAHAILDEKNKALDKDSIAHGPQFIWTAIELYHHYADINLQSLITSAHQNGILGDLDASYIPEPTENVDLDAEPEEQPEPTITIV